MVPSTHDGAGRSERIAGHPASTTELLVGSPVRDSERARDTPGTLHPTVRRGSLCTYIHD